MKLVKGVLPLLLVFRVLPAAADVLTDLFPPETKVVLGIRVHNIAISPLTKAVIEKAQAGDWLKLVVPSGFDPFRDIDEVMIAAGAQSAKAPALVVLTGHFDAAKLGGGSERYRDAVMIGGGKTGDSVIALIDKSTAVAGELSLVRATLDRRAAGMRIDASLNDRITSLRQRYDVWGLGERLEGFSTPIAEAKSLESIDRFQFGMQLTSGLELGAEIHARSSKDMEKLSETLQMMAAILNAKSTSENGSKFDLKVEGDTMKLAVSIPEEELKKALQSETVAPIRTRPAITEPAGDLFLAAPVAAPLEEAPAVPEASRMPPPPGKPGESQVMDKAGNTVILKLPGKK